ncbi:MAG: hypothetical protein WC785_06560 [Tatlockia sp.]|jgi:hypothetical protein
MTSSFSFIDGDYSLHADNVVVSLVDAGSIHPDGRKIHSGLLILEFLDAQNVHTVLCYGNRFGHADQWELQEIPAEQRENISQFFKLRTSWRRPKEEARSVLEVFEEGRRKEEISTLTAEKLPFYSYKKASDALPKLFQITLPSEIDLEFLEAKTKSFQLTPGSFIPFHNLLESRTFPLARLRRSNWWKRIKDTFEGINGGFIEDNQLGLLDFIFPFSRLFINLTLSEKIPTLVKALLFPFTAITWLLKTVFALAVMVPAMMIVSVVHLPFYLLKKRPESLKTASIISNNIEAFADLKGDNLAEGCLNSNDLMQKKLRIRPLAHNKEEGSYTELTATRKLHSPEELMLGLYREGRPYALINPTDAENKTALVVLLKNNFFHIDEALEQANVMDDMLKSVSY